MFRATRVDSVIAVDEIEIKGKCNTVRFPKHTKNCRLQSGSSKVISKSYVRCSLTNSKLVVLLVCPLGQ